MIWTGSDWVAQLQAVDWAQVYSVCSSEAQAEGVSSSGDSPTAQGGQVAMHNASYGLGLKLDHNHFQPGPQSLLLAKPSHVIKPDIMG